MQKPTHLWHWAIALLAGIFLTLIYSRTSWDQALIAPFYDAPAHAFPLRNHWFFDSFMHQGLKMALLLVPILCALLWLGSWQDERLAGQRRRLGWLVLAQALPPLLVSVFKQQSVHACPWDLAQYGGYAPYLQLFEALPAGFAPGRCLPGGHASAGYALLAFYFGTRDRWPRFANGALCAGLVLGTLMGLAQVVRGAHFLSHNLWTLWITWVTLLVLYQVWPPVVKKEVSHAA